VVVIDLGVTTGRHGQIEAPVATELVEHVVKEGHAGCDVHLPGPVEVYLDEHRGFLGLTLDASDAAHMYLWVVDGVDRTGDGDVALTYARQEALMT
jgi:hypothetical protein